MHDTFKMLYRCPYENGHVYLCSKVGWLAHPVSGHGKKSGYSPVDIYDRTVLIRFHTFLCLVTGH